VTVAGYAIPGGMLYIGKGLASVAGYGIEPALIDPSLPVSRSSPDRSGAGMTYWPSYSSIPRECRAAYLDWLAGGRRDPSAYIGYVFLFFYGLERRALADTLRSEQAKRDVPAVIREVEELLKVYGGNGSFRGYSSQFLDALKLTHGESGEVEPPMDPVGYELPLSVRVGIGRIIAAGKPLPADWALSWFLTHPETHRRTPAKRCPQEFRELFRGRYARAFGDGLVLKPNRSKLNLAIRPASASFGGDVGVSTNLPDVGALTAPLSKLREIGESCAADLDAFSRWVGRNPEAPKTIAAVALLPPELAKTDESQETRGLWDWIEKTLEPHDRAVCSTDELLQHCASFGGGKLAKSEAVLLAQLLEKGGFGIEPDVRFGGAPLAPGGAAVIFKLPGDTASFASPQYAAATVLLHLAVAVSAADGSISAAEERHLEEHMQRSLTLSNTERVRLSAHLSWLMQSRPGLTSLRKRLEALDARQRRTMAEFVIGVAGADGQISPEEIQTIGKIYPMLGLDVDDVYGHVHAMATGAAIALEGGERSAAGSAQRSGGYTIPVRPGLAGPVQLDTTAVKKKLAESAQISAILDDIFTDEEPERVVQPGGPVSPMGKMPHAHCVLLSKLVERSEWSRADFERIAAECTLLPDGAVDALNEAAFDLAGTPVIEGDDPIQIDSATAKELLA
jgi:tellurite resistance protein